MLKKDVEVRWTKEARESFDKIKQALVEAPILVSPDYKKDFLTFFLLMNILFPFSTRSQDKLN